MMASHPLTRREAAAIRESLIRWRDDDKVTDPVIPAYHDEDGDGEVDFYGLDSFGQLELRPGGSQGTNVAATFGTESEIGP